MNKDADERRVQEQCECREINSHSMLTEMKEDGFRNNSAKDAMNGDGALVNPPWEVFRTRDPLMKESQLVLNMVSSQEAHRCNRSRGW